MYAVGKLGSYISRGVVTVAAPFHPFGGAVDIVVVEQEDGSFKSSPWYVQFGKFQGVLKAREKVVSINVNGLDADFRMYLDSRGGAYFLREADEGEADSGSWGAIPDSVSSMRRPKKIRSCNYDMQRFQMVTEFEAANAKVTRSSSSGPRILGFVFGGNENSVQQGDDAIGKNRGGSLERAEMAADLLEVKWSTSLATRKQWRGSDSPNLSVNGDSSQASPSAYTDTGSQTDYSMTPDSNGFGNNSFCSVSTDGGYTETSPSKDSENFMESFTLKEKYFGANGTSNVGSKTSSAATLDDVPTVLETEVEVTLDSKTDEGPVKYVTKMVVDQDSTNQDPSLTNSLLIEEATSAALDLMENLRSEKQCSSPSNSTSPGSSEKHGSLVINVTRNGHESDNCGESNGQKVGGLRGKDDEGHEAQFFFSDLENLERKIALTVDTGATTLDSLAAEKNPQNSFTGEESDGSTETVEKSHSFTEELPQKALPNHHPCSPKISRTSSSPISIATDREQADHIAQIDAFSSSWSHGIDMNPQDVNQPISRSLDSSFDNMMLVQGEVPTTSENGIQKQQTTPRKSSLEQYQISEKLKELLSDPAVEISLCRHSVHEGMGYEAATHAFDSEKVDVEKFISLGPDVIQNDKVVVRIGGLYFPWDAALPIVSAIGAPRGEQILEPKGMIHVEQVENAVESNPQQSMDASNGTWRLWPFKKTMSRRNSVVVDATPRYPTGNTDTPKSNNFRSDTLKSETIKKNVVRKKTPTSDQLESLNLKEGRNEVIFTFSTPMLGEQKVDARIYLWKWNARIVISDVDGTITKSDVLGQFMPMVGVDWSQTGVTHLFSAIKENGYELLFLSARAISQASLTRQFLFNLKQDGVALPEGPVVISPDGLFPSLFREVIRRAPHEFKIACLEDIKALFPLDQNPFYAGFGNRDTDELSYVKVGIPKGKVFIINPKGEVAVHRCVDTKSYTSLHDLVHEMFPDPTAVPPTEKEDYNSWNFWRLPPPDIV